MKLNAALLAVGSALTLAIVLAITTNPIWGIAALIVVLSVPWCIARPQAAAYVLAFLTAAFPKAGFKLGDFPLPVFLFGLIFAVILLGLRRKLVPVSAVTTVLTLAWVVFVISRTITLYETTGFGGAAAFAAWTGGPVVLLYLAVRQPQPDVRFRKSIEWGFLLSVVFGLVQLLGGVEKTAIAGLTYAYGDDLTQKHNIIYNDSGVADYSKIPSTYQNGNIYGLVAAGIFAMALSRIVRRTGSRLDYLLVLGTSLAIALSGSRTAIIAAAAVVLIIVLRGGRLGVKLGIAALLGVVASVVIALQPGLVDRYSIADVIDSGGAGRSAMWTMGLATHPAYDFLVGAPVDPGIEGWLGMLLRIGWVGVALLGIVVAALCRGRKQLALPLVVLVIGAVIDSSYLLFPTWFIFAALAAGVPAERKTPPSAKTEVMAEGDVKPRMEPAQR